MHDVHRPASPRSISDGDAGAIFPRVVLLQTQAENAGAQEISRLLAKDLSSRGFDVRQVFFFRRTASFDGDPKALFCAAARPGGPLSFPRFLLSLFTIIRELKPDVVVTFQHYGNVIGAPVARLAGVRKIIVNQVSASAMVNRWLVAADAILGRLGVYDRIVVNSDYTEEMFKTYPDSYRGRILRIDHGFEDKTTAIGKVDARARLGLPERAPLLGCAARLNSLKQLDAAIAILPRLPDAWLVLAGQGPDESRLRTLARETGVSERVIFLGEIPAEKIGTFLASLDCFVFPSSAETFGLAPVEAAQSGLPVVANDLSVLREVLNAGGEPCAIFVDARDPAAFADAVRKVLDDPGLAAKLGAAGRRLKERYPLSEMTDAYARLVLSLAQAPHADRH
jgi:glycosyltransferase involved in cell wall biosynthesis